jgi:hypothetical protein
MLRFLLCLHLLILGIKVNKTNKRKNYITFWVTDVRFYIVRQIRQIEESRLTYRDLKCVIFFTECIKVTRGKNIFTTEKHSFIDDSSNFSKLYFTSQESGADSVRNTSYCMYCVCLLMHFLAECKITKNQLIQ